MADRIDSSFLVVRSVPVYYHIASQLHHLVLGVCQERACPRVAMVPMKTGGTCDGQLWQFEQWEGDSLYIVSKLDHTGQMVLDYGSGMIAIRQKLPCVVSQLFTISPEGYIASAVDDSVVLSVDSSLLDEDAPAMMRARDSAVCSSHQMWSFVPF